MDISRNEQRILHLLAQGGRIEIEKNERKKVSDVRCLTRDGWRYPGFVAADCMIASTCHPCPLTRCFRLRRKGRWRCSVVKMMNRPGESWRACMIP